MAMQRFFEFFRRKNYGALWNNLFNFFHLWFFDKIREVNLNLGVSPPNVGVGLSGTLSIPLSLHFVQTTPTIPYAKNEQSRDLSKKQNKKAPCNARGFINY